MIRKHEQSLSVDEFILLYNSVGWNPPEKEQVALALNNSNYTICVKDGEKTIGMGRVIGDKAMSFFIKDVAVLPEYQGQGIGRIIINSIIEHIKTSVPKGYGVCVELISSKGMEPFYEKFGFGKKPSDGMGHGMMSLVIGETVDFPS